MPSTTKNCHSLDYQELRARARDSTGLGLVARARTGLGARVIGPGLGLG